MVSAAGAAPRTVCRVRRVGADGVVCAHVVGRADGSSVIPVAAVASKEMALVVEYLTENLKQPLKRIERVLCVLCDKVASRAVCAAHMDGAVGVAVFAAAKELQAGGVGSAGLGRGVYSACGFG